jgi:hypothetical protein
LIRLSVDNVLLINTLILSIVIDKTIPLSIGCPNTRSIGEISFSRTLFRTSEFIILFYYEQQVKRELQRIHVSGCRCNERPEAKTRGIQETVENVENTFHKELMRLFSRSSSFLVTGTTCTIKNHKEYPSKVSVPWYLKIHLRYTGDMKQHLSVFAITT